MRAQTAMIQALRTLRTATRVLRIQGAFCSRKRTHNRASDSLRALALLPEQNQELCKIQNKQGPPGRGAVNLVAGFTSTHTVLSTQVETIWKCLSRLPSRVVGEAGRHFFLLQIAKRIMFPALLRICLVELGRKWEGTSHLTGTVGSPGNLTARFSHGQPLIENVRLFYPAASKQTLSSQSDCWSQSLAPLFLFV